MRSIFFPARKFHRVVFAHRALSDSLFFRHGRFARADRREPGEGGVQIRHNGPADAPRGPDRLESAGYQLSNLSGEKPMRARLRADDRWVPRQVLGSRSRESSRPTIFLREESGCACQARIIRSGPNASVSSRQSRSVKSVLLNRRECTCVIFGNFS